MKRLFSILGASVIFATTVAQRPGAVAPTPRPLIPGATLADPIDIFRDTFNRREVTLLINIANTLVGKGSSSADLIANTFVTNQKDCNDCFYKRFKSGSTAKQVNEIADLTVTIGKHLPECLRASLPKLMADAEKANNRLNTLEGVLSDWKPWAWNVLKDESLLLPELVSAAHRSHLDAAIIRCQNELRSGKMLGYAPVAHLQVALLKFLRNSAKIASRYCHQWEIKGYVLDIAAIAQPLHRMIDSLADKMGDFFKNRTMDLRRRVDESGVLSKSCASWAVRQTVPTRR